MMKKQNKKKLMAVVLILIVIWFRPRSLYSVAGIKANEVNCIEFFDLSRNPHSIKVTEKEKTNKFLKFTDKFIIAGGVPNLFSSGDLNGIAFISNNKNVQMTICPESKIIDINGFTYIVFRNGLSKKDFDAYLKSIQINN